MAHGMVVVYICFFGVVVVLDVEFSSTEYWCFWWFEGAGWKYIEGTARKWKDIGLTCLRFSNLCVYFLFLDLQQCIMEIVDERRNYFSFWRSDFFKGTMTVENWLTRRFMSIQTIPIIRKHPKTLEWLNKKRIQYACRDWAISKP